MAGPHAAAVGTTIAVLSDTTSIRIIHPNLADTLRVAVDNFPAGDPLWIKVWLPFGLAVLAILGALAAAHYGAVIGGKQARLAAEESQRAYFEEEARRRLTPAIRVTKRHLEGVAINSETLAQSPSDLEIAPTLLLALHAIVRGFDQSAEALSLLADEKLDDDIRNFFENVEMNANSIERGERVFKENLARIGQDHIVGNTRVVELNQQRNQRQDWIRQVVSWKPQAEALIVRLGEAEKNIKGI